MPKEPEPPTPQEPETEITEIETFKIYPVPADPNDTRDIYYVKRTIVGRTMLGKDKYGETIYIDSTGEEFRPTGNKDEYERKGSTGVYKRYP